MKHKNAIILKLILISETIMNKIDLLFILFLRRAQAVQGGEFNKIKMLLNCLHPNEKA